MIVSCAADGPVLVEGVANHQRKKNPIVLHSEFYESRATICHMSVKLDVLEISFVRLRSLIRHFEVV